VRLCDEECKNEEVTEVAKKCKYKSVILNFYIYILNNDLLLSITLKYGVIDSNKIIVENTITILK
jgi:hypothetical protein